MKEDSYNPECTRRLLDAAREGDRAAADRLVRTWQAPLLGWVRSRVGPARADADDIVQQVWLDVFANLGASGEEGGYDPRRSGFLTWLLGRFVRYRVLQWSSERAAGRRTGGLDGAGEPADRGPSGPVEAAAARDLLARRARSYSESFRLLFLCGGYPHQQLAFAFSKLLHGRPSPRAVEGSADVVHQHYGPVPLGPLLDRFWSDYRQELTEADAGTLAGLLAGLEPVRDRLALPVEEVLCGDRASLLCCAAESRSRACGEVRLMDFYAGHARGHTGAIPDWCFKVERRTRALLGGSADPCLRCKLRRLPPCRFGRPAEAPREKPDRPA
jgi:DNA-directed RNA polymerase specialized sigma24 family protein